MACRGSSLEGGEKQRRRLGRQDVETLVSKGVGPRPVPEAARKPSTGVARVQAPSPDPPTPPASLPIPPSRPPCSSSAIASIFGTKSESIFEFQPGYMHLKTGSLLLRAGWGRGEPCCLAGPSLRVRVHVPIRYGGGGPAGSRSASSRRSSPRGYIRSASSTGAACADGDPATGCSMSELPTEQEVQTVRTTHLTDELAARQPVQCCPRGRRQCSSAPNARLDFHSPFDRGARQCASGRTG